MQAIVEILPEASGLDLGQRIPVGGTDKPHIDRFQPTATDPLKAAGLDEAQQLALQIQLHLADFIEEQGSAIGARSGTGPITQGAGEGPFDVTKDLALNQIPRNGGTVEHHQRLVMAGAQAMKGFGAHLLARATLAGDEHRRLAGCRALQHVVNPLHRQ